MLGQDTKGSIIIPREVVTGPKTWLSLDMRLLSLEEKEIVNKDPNLSDETVQKLLKMLPRGYKRHRFYFSDAAGSDVGLTGLSCCIRENKDATMAELVARYSDLRTIPFAEVADEVTKLYKETGLFYYEETNLGGFGRLKWEPKKVEIMFA